MEIATKSSGTSVDIIITGVIKTILDGQSIKETVSEIYKQDAQRLINLHIKDSFIITSSIIGFLIKAIQVDKMALSVYAYSDELYTMLEDMSLIESMNVRKG